MANTTILFATLLILLGAGGYFGSGTNSPTALIPAIFGVVLLILGLVARNPARRKHAMHGAAMVALLGLFGSIRGLLQLPTVLSGGEVARPAAVIAQSIMAVLMIIFVALAIRSFVEARRSRAI
jgi:uncharacterized membrane protein